MSEYKYDLFKSLSELVERLSVLLLTSGQLVHVVLAHGDVVPIGLQAANQELTEAVARILLGSCVLLVLISVHRSRGLLCILGRRLLLGRLLLVVVAVG